MSTLGSEILRSYDVMQYVEFVVRLLMACICGWIIGLERSKRLKEAGIRTHMIVCAAAALTMVVSKYGFSDIEYVAGVKDTDPARIAAQVVTGISFLGAGIIFNKGAAIKGLTTAAGIWATAAIGLALGAGMYVIGILTTVILSVVQIITHRFPVGGDAMDNIKVHFVVKDSKEFRQVLEDHMKEKKAIVMQKDIMKDEKGFVSYDLIVLTPANAYIGDLEDFLEKHTEVKEFGYSVL